MLTRKRIYTRARTHRREVVTPRGCLVSDLFLPIFFRGGRGVRRRNSNEDKFAGLMGNDSVWYFTGAKLFPNVKGCGYPPMLNCSIFYRQYANIGQNFSCYYSKVDPGIVISDLDMWQVSVLGLAVVVHFPLALFNPASTRACVRPFMPACICRARAIPVVLRVARIRVRPTWLRLLAFSDGGRKGGGGDWVIARFACLTYGVTCASHAKVL